MAGKENKSPRRTWENDETMAFLCAYGKRQAEFSHPRKKKFAMQNVLEDLLAIGVLTQPTSADMLNTKLKNLLKAFKTARDNNNRTGQSLIKAPFEDILEELFGSQPIIQNVHTLNLSGAPIIGLPNEASHVEEQVFHQSSDGASTLLETTNLRTPTNQRSEQEISDDFSINLHSSKRNIRRKNAKDKYFEEKILLKREVALAKNEIKKEYYAAKIKKLEEAEIGKNERLKEKKKIIEEIFLS